MTARLRIYHPEYPVTWWDRLYDFFGGQTVRVPVVGVDYSLVHRASARALRELLDGVQGLNLLGAEMVRIDSTLRLPANPAVRRDLCEDLVQRIKFGQTLADETRSFFGIRWVEFSDTESGVRLIVRLVQTPNAGLRSFMAANLSNDPIGDWTEFGITRD